VWWGCTGGGKRWRSFFRLLKTGLEIFGVRGLGPIRTVLAILEKRTVFLSKVWPSGGNLKDLPVPHGGKLGIASELDSPYLLLRGLVRLLNYETTRKVSAAPRR